MPIDFLILYIFKFLSNTIYNLFADQFGTQHIYVRIQFNVNERVQIAAKYLWNCFTRNKR